MALAGGDAPVPRDGEWPLGNSDGPAYEANGAKELEQ